MRIASRITSLVLLVAVATTTFSAVAGAQYNSQARAFAPPPRWSIGGGFDYAKPVSQFGQNVDHGFGGGGFARVGLDRGGLLSIRADVDFLSYGHDTQYLPFGYYELQQETSNNVVVATIGPQLTIPLGGPSLYANGGVGVGYFYTETSLSDYNSQQTYASQTNYSDNSLVYAAGAGLTIPFSFARQTLAIDLGARYHAIGTTRYLTKGDIQEDPNNPYNVIITPHESDARFMTYRLGLVLSF